SSSGHHRKTCRPYAAVRHCAGPLTGPAAHGRPRGGGGLPMRFPVVGRACAALMALAISVASVAAPAPAPVAPVEAAPSPRVASQLAFDELKRQLDRITLDTHDSGLTEEELATLRRELQEVRDRVRAALERLEPRLAEVETRLSQLGPAPAAGQ